MDNMEAIGVMAECPYCGQVISATLQDGETSTEAAIRLCDCNRARMHKRRMERLEQAKDTLQATFGEEAAEKYGLKAVSEEVMDLLQTLARMLVDDKIVSVTVQCADSCKAKLAVGGKCEIKITRSEGWSISMSV